MRVITTHNQCFYSISKPIDSVKCTSKFVKNLKLNDIICAFYKEDQDISLGYCKQNYSDAESYGD